MSAALVLAGASGGDAPALRLVRSTDRRPRSWDAPKRYREPDPKQLARFEPVVAAILAYAACHGSRAAWFTFTSDSRGTWVDVLRDLKRCWQKFRHCSAWRRVPGALMVLGTHGRRAHLHVLAIVPEGVTLRDVYGSWMGGITDAELVRREDASALARYCAAQQNRARRISAFRHRSFEPLDAAAGPGRRPGAPLVLPVAALLDANLVSAFGFPPSPDEIMLDTMERTRTVAQAEASKRNGALSSGPVIDAGKVASSQNGITHGLETSSALLPGESIDEYRSNLDAWAVTLGAQTPGEARLVGRVADITFRQARLARLEERVTIAAVDKAVDESRPAGTLKKLADALEGARGLLSLAESVKEPVDAAEVAKLAPAMRAVGKLMDEAGVPARPAAFLDGAVDALLSDSIETVEPESFAKLAQAIGVVVAELQRLDVSARSELEAERERLTEKAALAAGPEMAVIDRHRGRLARALEAELRALKAVRELARPDAAVSGSLVQPFLLEVRVLGRRRAP